MGEIKKGRLFFLLLMVCIMFLVGYDSKPLIQTKKKGMVSIAHRGAANFAPENTMPAFLKAQQLGADYLECDVHLSKDGELIIIHDDKLDRTTNGTGYVKDYTLAELKELDAGHKFHASFAGEKIITLNELLEQFYGEIGLLIEIKKPTMYPGIEEKIVEVLSEYRALSGIIVQSFDVESMRKMKELLPQLDVAILMKRSIKNISLDGIKDLTSFATYINFNVSYANKSLVKQIHNHGGKVLVWSTKDQRKIEKAFNYKVDGIITDYSIWPKEEQTHLAQE